MNGTQEKQKSECAQIAIVLTGIKKRIHKRRLCKCGCGRPVTWSLVKPKWNDYVWGHNPNEQDYSKTKGARCPSY